MSWPNTIKFACPECGHDYYLGAVEKGVQERRVECRDCDTTLLVTFGIEVTPLVKDVKVVEK